jgi:glycogen debranching enzyme
VISASSAPPSEVIDALLSPEGWAYASMLPVDESDPGRFHALFGRDSLIFALQLLPDRPEIAAATLRAHASFQGTSDDPEIDEQPGKIVHEYHPVAPDWLLDAGWPVRDGGIRYYGTSDATSWFLVVLAATGNAELQQELSANWRAAASWLEAALDAGGGFVRFGPRRYRGGLTQQGWRDSVNPGRDGIGSGIVTEDISAPPAPVADADTQAVAAAALRALITLDPDRAPRWQERLAALRSRIAERFTPETMAIDGEDKIVPGAGSQLGWLLWSGALDKDAAGAFADRLTQADILTPYGLRTLSVDHPGFLAASYHRGSIWPFDNWIGWLGLRAYGYQDAAEHVRTGVLRALEQLGLYPELYAVTPQGELASIPIANRIQAWTVGAAWAFTNS